VKGVIAKVIIQIAFFEYGRLN